jgi:hypothetical protein
VESPEVFVGLDLLEFTLAVEDAFGLFIPNEDIETLTTPGIVIEYLAGRLAPNASPACLTQRAFYVLRSTAMTVLQAPRETIRPDSPWHTLLDPKHTNRQWELLAAAVGAKPWPRLPRFFGKEGATVGATAEFLATRAPHALKRATEGWSRAEITSIIGVLMKDELGVEQYAPTDRFVQDLHCD